MSALELQCLFCEENFCIENFSDASRRYFRIPLERRNDSKRLLETFTDPFPHIECFFNPNGDEEGDEDYISLLFELDVHECILQLCWTCVVSVVDNVGRPRFLQSVVFENDEAWESPTIDEFCPPLSIPFRRFVRRRVLLDDEEEYLPGGTLTFRCEVEIRYDLNVGVTQREAYAVRVDSLDHDIEIPNFREAKGEIKFLFFPNDVFVNETLLRITKLMYVHVECEIYPNDENHISLLFKLHLPRLSVFHVSWSCVVSVVNNEDLPTFHRSVVLRKGTPWSDLAEDDMRVSLPSISIKRFIERRLLLDGELEYLSGGTLTLRCEMEVRCEYGETKEYIRARRHWFVTDFESGIVSLKLNSSLFPLLTQESPGFEELLNSGASAYCASSTSSNLMPIRDDPRTFADMLYFIRNSNLAHVHGTSALFRLYELADKYLIARLIVECRKQLFQSLDVDNVSDALIMAYRCFDEELRDFCFEYIQSLSPEERLSVMDDIIKRQEKRIVTELFP